MLPPAGQQMIGSAFVLQYITYFLELIGVGNYFLVSLILYIFMLLSNLVAFFVVEVVGRRKLLVSGMFLLTLICLLLGIMGCLNTNGAQWFAIICIFLWYVTRGVMFRSLIQLGFLTNLHALTPGPLHTNSLLVPLDSHFLQKLALFHFDLLPKALLVSPKV